MTEISRLLTEIVEAQDEQRRGFSARVPGIRAEVLRRRAAERRRSGLARAAGFLAVAAGLAFALWRINAETTVAESETIAGERPSPLREAPPAVAEAGDESTPTTSPPARTPDEVLPARDATPPPVSSIVQNGPGWRELARAGKYEPAFAVAQKEGLSPLYQKSNADDLLLLAEAARFSGNVSVSKEALESIRSRFAGRPQAAMATFSLGRLEADVFGSPGSALRYFETYLKELPNGPLASSAAGRIIELRQKMGDDAGAAKAARLYVDRYPEGAHAELARSVMSSAKSP